MLEEVRNSKAAQRECGDFSCGVLFQGGVVLVSHDERLIRLVCKELWVCEAGCVHRIDGGFDEYKNILQEQFRKEGYL